MCILMWFVAVQSVVRTPHVFYSTDRGVWVAAALEPAVKRWRGSEVANGGGMLVLCAVPGAGNKCFVKVVKRD